MSRARSAGRLRQETSAKPSGRLHIESVRFDEWVRVQREKLAQTRQMAPANENARPSAIADAMEEYARESEAHFAQLYAMHDEEDGLPYDQWLVERERRDREVDAEYFAEERRNRTVALAQLFEDWPSSSSPDSSTPNGMQASTIGA